MNSIIEKKAIFLTIICILFSLSSKALAIDTAIYLDGEKIVTDTAPKVKNGVTFIPVRVISENLGADVYYDISSDNGKEYVLISNYTTEPHHRQQNFANGAVANWVESSITITNGDPIVRVGYSGIVHGESEPRFWDNEDKIELAAAPYLNNQRMMVPLRFIAERMGLTVNYTKERIDLISNLGLTLDGVRVKDILMSPEQDIQYITNNKALIKSIIELLENSRGNQCAAISNYAYIMPEIAFRNNSDEIIAIWQFAAPASDDFREPPFSEVYLHDRLHDCWYVVDRQAFDEKFELLSSSFYPPYYDFKQLK